MAVKIGDYVLSGELRNSRRNGVFGWIEFAPDYGIRIELTGNFSNPLAGKSFRFKVPANEKSELPEPGSFPDVIEQLADRQIGVVGEMTLKVTRVPTVPAEEFMKMDERDRQKHSEEKECLYLEWFSQNGRVVAEILAPEIEYRDDEGTSDEQMDADALDDGAYGLGFTEIRLDENGDAIEELLDDGAETDGDEEDDPYGLFDESLDQKVAESLGPLPEEAFDGAAPPGAGKKRAWDEVIPGIDPSTKEMYEQWDEIFEGKKDEPLSYLFHSPLKLPKPDAVESDEDAWPLVTAILAQLALLSVALDVCEHFSPLDTYQLLMTEILPNAKVHPNLAASEMVQHYSTSDYCDACEAEFDDEEDSESDDLESEDPL